MTSNMQERQTDIVITGGGPVGLAAACSLSATGLEVMLVDAGTPPPALASLAASKDDSVFDPRVSALTAASQRLLEGLGAWDGIAAVRACPYRQMAVWDGEGTGSIDFSAADIHADNLGHIVENRLINAALGEVASRQDNLTIVSGDTVDNIRTTGEDYPVALELASGAQLQARLLIGADGAHSLVREQGGFTLRQWDYGHMAIVTTVKTAQPHQYTAWQRFMNTGPLAFLPLYLPGVEASAQQYCSIVWSCVTDKAQALSELDAAAFRQALGEAFEFRLGDILETDTRYSFPLWQRHTDDYVHANVALVGDAAHTIHPLAGQGVNLGFADVQALTEVITHALQRGVDYASLQVLSRYQRRRKGPNLAMMAAMEGFKRLFASDDLAVTWLRNTGLNLTNDIPLVKQQLMRQAMGL